MKKSNAARRASATGAVFAVAASLILAGAGTAFAAPAPEVITYTGADYDSVTPAGICAVNVTALGGGGGSIEWPPLADYGGAGASVTATYKVRPGMAVTGQVGGAGVAGVLIAGSHTRTVGGWPDGGDGGAGSEHFGGSGGGSTTVLIDGVELIVAGGGGGGGGGHTTRGVGGDGGLPSAPGVSAGTDGANGIDGPSTQTTGDEDWVPGGGQGGQQSAPGAGGVYNAPLEFVPAEAQTALGGFAGVGRHGGAGGDDVSGLDTGGGGGGGFFGGGGGASTYSNGAGGISAPGKVAGGAGGGASYVSATSPAGLGPVSGIVSAAGFKATGRNMALPGSVTLEWVDCGILTNDGATTDIEPVKLFV